MKTNKKVTKKKISQTMKRTKALVAMLIDGAHPLVDIVDRPWDRLRYGSDLESIDAYWEKVAHQRCLARLKKKKWIQQRKRGQELILELTSEGTIYALGQKIVAAKKKLAKGKICLISFDIPESARKARNTLRKIFKDGEFDCIHHSAWATDKDIGRDMKTLIRLLKIEDWVSVFFAEKVN